MKQKIQTIIWAILLSFSIYSAASEQEQTAFKETKNIKLEITKSFATDSLSLGIF